MLMKKVLKICDGDWKNASRDKRELSAYIEAGAEVVVMAKGNDSDKFLLDEVNGFRVYRFSRAPLKTFTSNIRINHMVSFFTWAIYARKFKPDVISGHDLSGLIIAWLSTLFIRKKNKPRLIYDSHEFEIGRNSKRSKLKSAIIAKIEGFLIRKCEFTIAVNDSIADAIVKAHDLSSRPVVIRSTPNFWNVDKQVCIDTRNRMKDSLKGINFLMMYHGNVMNGRGVETLLTVVRDTEDIGLALIGTIRDDFKKVIDNLIFEYDISHKVFFHESVPIEELWKYVGAADVSMATISPIVRSYYFALPNKLFEAIQSETPVIVSDLPELRKIVDDYGIGLIVRPDNAEDIRNAIDSLRSRKANYAKMKSNLKIAKLDLCWEQEKTKLINAFDAIC